MKKVICVALFSMILLILVSCKKEEEPYQQASTVDGIFKDNSFGISMDIDPSWVINEIKIDANAKSNGYKELLNVSKTWDEFVDDDAINPKLTISATSIDTTKAPLTAEENLAASFDYFKAADENFIGDIKTVTLNGKEFAYSKNRIDANPNDGFYADSIIYRIIINDHYVTINGVYNEISGGEQEILTMLASLNIE